MEGERFHRTMFNEVLQEDSTDEEDFEMSPQLREEIVLMRKLYGIDCITERYVQFSL